MASADLVPPPLSLPSGISSPPICLPSFRSVGLWKTRGRRRPTPPDPPDVAVRPLPVLPAVGSEAPWELGGMGPPSGCWEASASAVCGVPSGFQPRLWAASQAASRGVISPLAYAVSWALWTLQHFRAFSRCPPLRRFPDSSHRAW